MTTTEQVTQLALLGGTLREVEATLGRQMSADERKAFDKARMIVKLRLAKERDERKRRERELDENLFTPEQFALGEAAIAAKKEEADALAARREERLARGRAMSGAERVARHVAAKSELYGKIPACADPDERERCRLDLVRFGLRYGMDFIRRPPSVRMEKAIRKLQDAILAGGKVHVRWPRGKGKSAWEKIALKWIACYGHRRFPLVLAVKAGVAFQFCLEVWISCRFDKHTVADFPEIAIPLQHIGESAQRRAHQRYRGQPTFIDVNTRMDYRRFAVLEGYPNTGVIMAWRGFGSAVRGLNVQNTRPDFIVVDDPQKDGDAKSEVSVDELEKFITGTVEALSDTNTTLSGIMATTCIEPDDLSERFADSARHPEWMTYSDTLVISWPKDPEPMREYIRRVEADLAKRDMNLTDARAWYAENQEKIEDGVEMLDPGDGDYEHGDISAFQWALHKLQRMKNRFYAEYQGKPEASMSAMKLDVYEVQKHVNGTPRGVLPAFAQRCVAFCDVNSVAGLRWAVMAIGAGNTAAVIDYGRWPHGTAPLFPAGTPNALQGGFVKVAMARVAGELNARQYPRLADGKPARVSLLVFDGGDWTADVADVCTKWETARKADPSRIPVAWSRGYAWNKYRPHMLDGNRSTVGEHWHMARSPNGEYLAFMADYWREVAQLALQLPVGAPGGVSLWGTDITAHHGFVQEVAAEEMKTKFKRPDGFTQWEWKKTGENHWGDVLYGCFVCASAIGLYRPAEADEEVGKIDAALAAPAMPRKVKYILKKRRTA